MIRSSGILTDPNGDSCLVLILSCRKSTTDYSKISALLDGCDLVIRSDLSCLPTM